MDIVELGAECPLVLGIIDFETTIWWYAFPPLVDDHLQHGQTYYRGWIGLRSVPNTVAPGNT